MYCRVTADCGCPSESALAAAGPTGIAPGRPVVVAAAAHQLNFRDEYHPLSRPLPLHLPKLAEEYCMPLAAAPASAPEAGRTLRLRLPGGSATHQK